MISFQDRFFPFMLGEGVFRRHSTKTKSGGLARLATASFAISIMSGNAQSVRNILHFENCLEQEIFCQEHEIFARKPFILKQDNVNNLFTG